MCLRKTDTIILLQISDKLFFWLWKIENKAKASSR